MSFGAKPNNINPLFDNDFVTMQIFNRSIIDISLFNYFTKYKMFVPSQNENKDYKLAKIHALYLNIHKSE